ncbi:dienelactone hydrolase family protein [Siccirubricoccus deserti]
MIETTLDIATADGAMESFICRPERGGPFPAVLMLMDAPGIREELRDMARRLATVGYYVVLPNLYYRAGRDSVFGPGVLTMGDPERDRMRAIRTKMTIPPVMEDVGAMLRFLDTQKEAKPGPVGTHGYCMSGPSWPPRPATRTASPPPPPSTAPGWSATRWRARISRSAVPRASSTSAAPSMTSWRRCRWSRS